MRIVHRDAAEDDISAVSNYIAKDNLEAAVRLLEALDETYDRLREQPEIGSPCANWNPDLHNIRRWPIIGFKKYLIFYTYEKDKIEIIRVLHTSRDIEFLLAKDLIS